LQKDRPFHLSPFSQALAATAVLWGVFFLLVRDQWSINSEYKYGWYVPILAGYLLWLRLSDRAPAVPAPARVWPAAGVIAVLAATLLPLRIIQEANPDWRMVSWIVFFGISALTCAALYLVGGKAWFQEALFPCLFLGTAVPWPQGFERFVTQSLMHGDVRVAIEVLTFLGIPCAQNGNVIQVSNGLIGLEEACSGIRSLQVSFMFSLFFGELFHLSPKRRVLLVFVAACSAFCANLMRTTTLSIVGAKFGIPTVNAWHDPAGNISLGLCFCAVMGFAFLWRAKQPLPVPPRETDSTAPPLASSYAHRARAFAWAVGAFIVWMLAVEGANRLWYGPIPQITGTPTWPVRWPSGLASFQTITVPDYAQRMLNFDDSEGGSWRDEDGSAWEFVRLRWRPGRAAAQAVLDHNPKVCMTSNGLDLIKDFGYEKMDTAKGPLNFQCYQFADHGEPLWVFRCISNDLFDQAALAAGEGVDWDRTARIRAVLRRKRQLSDQVLIQAGVHGITDRKDAATAFHRQLDALMAGGESVHVADLSGK